MTSSAPRVSVILPIYNRRTFLAAAFDSILAQNITSCEVVVVDDGSADHSREEIDRLTASYPLAVRYIYQENQGAYGARNTGMAAAHGQYIAFYDSDDVWLPHHLPTCVAALDANADVDWVYGACELVDLENGTLLSPSSFYEGTTPRPFMRLQHETRGALHVITDPGAAQCQIETGLYCGLQNSVLRRAITDRLRFHAELRNEAEDQLYAIKALKAGFRLAYVDAVHVRYQVHAGNSSGASTDTSLAKRRRVYEPLIEGYRRLERDVALTPAEHRALRRRLGQELFWHLGYSGFWAAGERRAALRLYAEALKAWPWDLAQWKTYTVALLRPRS